MGFVLMGEDCTNTCANSPSPTQPTYIQIDDTYVYCSGLHVSMGTGVNTYPLRPRSYLVMQHSRSQHPCSLHFESHHAHRITHVARLKQVKVAVFSRSSAMNRSYSSVHKDVTRELDQNIDRKIRRLAEGSLFRFTGEAKCAFGEVGESSRKPKTEADSDTAVAKKTISRPSKTSSKNEVDFFSNPTNLSRLILNQKYASAIKRLR
jgi:hypothetical protein